MDELIEQPGECVVVREWVDGYARHGAECSCGVYVSSVKLRESVLEHLGDAHPILRTVTGLGADARRVCPISVTAR